MTIQVERLEAALTTEAIEERYTAFKVECERIRHKLDVLEQTLNEQDANEPRKGLLWRLFNKEEAA